MVGRKGGESTMIIFDRCFRRKPHVCPDILHSVHVFFCDDAQYFANFVI